MAQTENYKLYVVGAGEDPYVKDFVEQLCGENASNMTIIDNALQELKTSVSEGKALVSSAVTDMGVSTADNATYATIASNIKNISNDATASAGEILSGKTAYVGGKKITGTIATKTSSDLGISGATVTVPAGYYASQATRSVRTAKHTVPSISVDSSGMITATSTISTGYIVGGTTSAQKQLPQQAAKTVTPSASAKTAVEAGMYTTGVIEVAAVPTQTKSVSPSTSTQTVAPDDGKFLSKVYVDGISTQAKSVIPKTSEQIVSPDNGKYLSSVTVGAIPSKYIIPIATKGAKTYTPSTSYQVIPSGTYLTGAQTIEGDSNLLSENIKSGISIFGVSGTLSEGIDTSDATATANDLPEGVTAYVNGEKVTGIIPERTISHVTLLNIRAYDSDMYTMGFVIPIAEDCLFRKESLINTSMPLSNFGDATAADVAVGKTFTSSAGLKVTGTGTASSYKMIDIDNDNITVTQGDYHTEITIPNSANISNVRALEFGGALIKSSDSFYFARGRNVTTVEDDGTYSCHYLCVCDGTDYRVHEDINSSSIKYTILDNGDVWTYLTDNDLTDPADWYYITGTIIGT